MTLTYRQEYAKALGAGAAPPVQLVQEWLAARLADRPATDPVGRTFRLLPHCTERTTAAPSLKDWGAVFRRLGLTLEVAASGCCGMAGTFGHEARHRATSEAIYRASWGGHVAADRDGALLATGFSCRCQAELVDGRTLPHPVQALLAHLADDGAGRAPARSLAS